MLNIAPICRSPTRDAVAVAWPWSLATVKPTRQTNVKILSRTETLLKHLQAFDNRIVHDALVYWSLRSLLGRLVDVEINGDGVLNTIAGCSDGDRIVMVEVPASAA